MQSAVMRFDSVLGVCRFDEDYEISITTAPGTGAEDVKAEDDGANVKVLMKGCYLVSSSRSRNIADDHRSPSSNISGLPLDASTL